MASFEFNNASHQASRALSSFAVPVPQTKRRVWAYIGIFSIASFAIGTLCGYYALMHGREIVAEELYADELSQELGLGIDTLLTWFPEKNAKLKGKKQDIILHMTNFSEEESNPEVKNFVIDTTEKDTDQSATVPDRRLQTAPKCKEAVLDFILAFSGWLKGFVKFALPGELEMRKNMTSWLDRNIIGPTAFQKLISKMVDFAYKRGARDRLKVLWAIIKDAFKFGGSWIKEIVKQSADALVEGRWPKTKTLVRLAAQLATWIRKGPVDFVGHATLQYLSTEMMIDKAKLLRRCRNTTLFADPKK